MPRDAIAGPCVAGAFHQNRPPRPQSGSEGAAALKATSLRGRGGLAPHVLRRAQAVLLANLETGRASRAIARELGLSPDHFTRAFREAVGLPPHQWRISARIETAKTLIATGSSSLAEIAVACGFSDQAHLTRMFKREEGVSPAAWRRRSAALKTEIS